MRNYCKKIHVHILCYNEYSVLHPTFLYGILVKTRNGTGVDDAVRYTYNTHNYGGLSTLPPSLCLHVIR